MPRVGVQMEEQEQEDQYDEADLFDGRGDIVHVTSSEQSGSLRLPSIVTALSGVQIAFQDALCGEVISPHGQKDWTGTADEDDVMEKTSSDSPTNAFILDEDRAPNDRDPWVDVSTGGVHWEVFAGPGLEADEDLFDEPSPEANGAALRLSGVLDAKPRIGPKCEEEAEVPVSTVLLHAEQALVSELMRDFASMQREQLTKHHRSVERALVKHHADLKKLVESASLFQEIKNTGAATKVTFISDDDEERTPPGSETPTNSDISRPRLHIRKSMPEAVDLDFKRGSVTAGNVRRTMTGSVRANSSRLSSKFRDSTWFRADNLSMLRPSSVVVGEIQNFCRQASGPWTGNDTGTGTQNRMYTFVQGRFFQNVVVTLLLTNAIFIGFSGNYQLTSAFEEYDAREGESRSNYLPLWMVVVDVGFISAFIVEICFRVMAFHWDFFLGEEWLWNSVDVVTLITAILEVLLLAVDFDFSFVRLMRLLRAPSHSFRVVRSVRLGALVRTLRLILLALMKSFVPFFWALLILLLTIFMFAVIFVNAVASHVQQVTQVGDVLDDDVKLFFDSMSMALLTLFMSISGGVDWYAVWKVLHRISPAYSALFVLYVLLAQLAVLNIITGIFVNDALENASDDHDLLMQKTIKENRTFLKKLKLLFEKMTPDGSTCITLDDFQKQLESHEVRLMFQFLGLGASDAISLFRMLDADSSGNLEIEEFIMGFMRLRGKGNMIDIECTLRDMNKAIKSSSALIEKKFSEIYLKLDVCDVTSSLS